MPATLLGMFMAKFLNVSINSASCSVAAAVSMYRPSAMSAFMLASWPCAATARAIERATRKELEDMLALFVDAAVVEPEEAKR